MNTEQENSVGPSGLSDGVGAGWVLLPDGEPLKPGNGFLHPNYPFWIDFVCRPDLFRGEREYVQAGWPWRRKAPNAK